MGQESFLEWHPIMLTRGLDGTECGVHRVWRTQSRRSRKCEVYRPWRTQSLCLIEHKASILIIKNMPLLISGNQFWDSLVRVSQECSERTLPRDYYPTAQVQEPRGHSTSKTPACAGLDLALSCLAALNLLFSAPGLTLSIFPDNMMASTHGG